nr:MAG TPA: DNA-directed RNA polymerase II subunit [Caudoviricetes sp.]
MRHNTVHRCVECGFGTLHKVRKNVGTRFIVPSLSFVCTKNVTTLYRHVRKGIPTYEWLTQHALPLCSLF